MEKTGIDWITSGYLAYNKKVSEKEKHNPKHKLFVDWCLENGLKWTGADFPAYFGDKGELRGMVATKDIQPYEVIIAIPNKLLMTSLKAREDKALAKMFEAEDEHFGEDETGEYNVLIAFLIRERLKGKDSFYFPFLNLVDEIETGLVWDEKTIGFIEDPIFKDEVREGQMELERDWDVLGEVLEKYPKLFPDLTRELYNWANQFVTTRCFGWYMPCTMLVPMADLINHYAQETCTTDVTHLGLEREKDKEKRERLKYRKMRGNYDMNLLLPKTYFDPGNRKSNAVHFVESFSRKVHNYQLLSAEEDFKLAQETATTLMEDHEEAEIWDLPNWVSDYKEDNETTESEEEREPDSEDEFFDQVSKLKEKLVDKPKKDKVEAKPKPMTNKQFLEVNAESQEKRKSVMDFDIGPTQKSSDLRKKSSRKTSVEVYKADSLDNSESFSEYQKEYPWYSSNDQEIYFLVANNRNKIIRKDTELKASYGSRTNRYLAIYYGFSLLKNEYDSYVFRLVVDTKLAKSAGLTHGVLSKHITAAEKDDGFITLNGLVISLDLLTTPFRIKFTRFANELLVYLRGDMYSQWLKKNPGKKKHKLTLSVPFDLSYEITVVSRFIDIFTVLQLNFKRSDLEDLKLLEFGPLNQAQSAIVTCELGWKRIIEQQIKFGKVILSILKTLENHPERNFRKIYLTRVPEVDTTQDSLVETRMKLKNYLKRLMLAPFVTSST